MSVLHSSSEGPTRYKKGNLEITVLQARGLIKEEKGNISYASYCVVDIAGSAPQISPASPEASWNYSLNFAITTLEETEALVQIYGKSGNKDKFLGQVNIPIKVLDLPASGEWYFLSDRPGKLDHIVAETSIQQGEKDSYVTGEIQLSFKFIHRLKREKTAKHLHDLSTAKLTDDIGELQNLVTDEALTENPESCRSEAVIVEESVKAKENMIYQTLSRKKMLVRSMSRHLDKIEKTQGKESVRIKKLEVLKFEQELEQVETTLKDLPSPPPPPPPPSSSSSSSSSSSRKSPAVLSPVHSPVKSRHSPSVSRNSPLSHSSVPSHHSPSPSLPLSPVVVSKPLSSSPSNAPQMSSLVNEVEFLRLKVELLQKELEKQQQVTNIVSSLMGKLEKLDRLDEIMKRLDNMKVAPDGGSDSSYAELKTQLEEIQQIIFDETGKYSEKEKEDANIRYEKTFTELAKTSEYREEIAKMKEEKRRVNEPLNKEALARMVKIYTPDAVRNNEAIKQKVAASPELLLIGMDPKAILAKHQNDFTQFALRITEIDELRAICASLPKFRNDQKRQLDFMETLENKIEQYMKDPPKPKVAKPAKRLKVKTAPAGAPSGDIFSELLAKRKQVG